MSRPILRVLGLAGLLAACGGAASVADADASARTDSSPAEPCPGYTGLRSCCAGNDPCGLAGDGACDCAGTCAWDHVDCGARCGADGICAPLCPADPDCRAACTCDHARDRCEPDAPCSGVPCACDPDCVGRAPCGADGACDALCPAGADPDCAGTAADGRACCRPACDGRSCGPDGCGDTCGACPASYGCHEGRCLIEEGCGVITDWGCCQGDVAIWCDDGELWQVDCGAGEPAEACGWDAEAGYYCGGSGADPDGIYEAACLYGPCTPDCQGRECGGDGCNGSCGECAEGEACKSGSCRPE